MENSVNVPPLETKISLFSFKNMKKQESFGFHLITALSALLEMLHALHSLWDALLPFGLLWWNMMICATCAKYYSWNRSRFRLQIVGRQFHGAVMGDADAEEIGEKSPLSLHQSEDASHVGIITSYASGSCAQACFAQTVDSGSCLFQQSLPSAEDCDMHRNELSTLDPHVDTVVTRVEDNGDHQFVELSSCEEAPVISAAHASKALDMTSASQLLPLHLFDVREARHSGLLEAASWAASPSLLPQQVAPLAVYDPSGCPQKLLEYLWMHSSVHMNRNLLKGKTLMQLLYTVFMNCSTIEECMHVMNAVFPSHTSSMIHGKEYTCLKRYLVRLQESRAFSVDYNVLQEALLSLETINHMRSLTFSEALEGTAKGFGSETGGHPSIVALEGTAKGFGSDTGGQPSTVALEGTTEDFSSETGGHPSTFNLSNLELRNDPGHPYNDCDEDGSEVMDSFYCAPDQFYDHKFVSGSQSSLDSNADVDAGDAVAAYPLHADTMILSGEDTGVFHGNSIQLNNDYFNVNGGSANWDVRYGGLQRLQEIDSVYGEYYRGADGGFGDVIYIDNGLVVDDALCGDWTSDEDGVVDVNSEGNPLRQSDTWWDDDAVLVSRQEHEEDLVEQTWQVV